jgi:hypothetical protein
MFPPLNQPTYSAAQFFPNVYLNNLTTEHLLGTLIYTYHFNSFDTSKFSENMATAAASVYPSLENRPLKGTVVLFDVDKTLSPARGVSFKPENFDKQYFTQLTC